MSHIASAAVVSSVLLTSAARAETCPAAVIDAVKHAFRNGTIAACAAHGEKRQKQLEASDDRRKEASS